MEHLALTDVEIRLEIRVVVLGHGGEDELGGAREIKIKLARVRPERFKNPAEFVEFARLLQLVDACTSQNAILPFF